MVGLLLNRLTLRKMAPKRFSRERWSNNPSAELAEAQTAFIGARLLWPARHSRIVPGHRVAR